MDKFKLNHVNDVGAQLGFPHLQIVSPHGISGGLVVFWKAHVDVSCISFDSRLVDLHVEYKAFRFYLSCVYGHPEARFRSHLWEKLQRLSCTRQGPWLMCGDFNDILTPLEKRGGRIRTPASCSDFRDMITSCDMDDLRFKGNPFSWVGNTRAGIVECCLDRVMANTEWRNLFPESETEFLSLAESDHRPLIITIAYAGQVKVRPFRYDKRLYDKPDFAGMIHHCWDHRTRYNTFSQKLSTCRSAMARWKRRNRFHAAETIQTVRCQLDSALRDATASVATIQQLRKQLNQAYYDEEVFWHLKSRNSWLKAGDRNTAFFHGVSKTRKPKTCIKRMVDDHGITHTRDEAIGSVAGDYFTTIFTASHTVPLDLVLPHLDKRVTLDMNAQLTRPVDDNEIKSAVFMIGPDKAPGHDGFSAAFYHQFWDTIGRDVCSMVQRFFSTGILEPDINHTQICLLPKVPNAHRMVDFRPISLCTVSYKIISKILVLRLKAILPALISTTQAAFVPGRSITDNILIAHELLHALKTNKTCAKHYVAIKTDISKAYDRVEWMFLETVMTKMGFDLQWISWIMSCVRTVSYSVLVNGSPYGHIVPSRGLRQGDPLSPYLFLLCAETLSQMLGQAQQRHEFSGMKLTRSCPPISHLLFADDSLFFCKATHADCLRMARIIHDYELISGQQVNLRKSSVIFGMKIPESRKQSLQHILGIHTLGGGGKYLGLPEQFGRNKSEILQDLLQRVNNNLNGWYNKYLSPAGKEILIKSVAQAQPVYTMSCFLLPKKLCDAMNSKISKFWWGQTDYGSRKISWLSWKRLSVPKREGGLGFKDLHNFNVALLGMQAWRLHTNPDSLLARLYKARYHSSTEFLSSDYGLSPSYGWRSIQEGKNLLRKGLRVQLGDGANTCVWSDHWLPTLPPRLANGSNHDLHLKVNALWKPGTREWDHDVLHSTLSPEDAALAASIRLSRFAYRDTVIWPYTPNSAYTVKSGYWVASHAATDTSPPPFPGSLDLTHQIWKLQIPPKLQHFLWRSLAGALPTAQRLQSRGVNISPTCQRCDLTEESITHVLFECPHSVAIWRCANFRNFDTHRPSLEDNIKELFLIHNTTSYSSAIRLLPFWLVWIIWKSRNDFLFRQRHVHPQEDATKGINATQEWILAHPEIFLHSSQNRTPPVIRSSRWDPPLMGWLKCNFDCTYKPGTTFMGVGWLIRDSYGGFIDAGWAKLPQVASSLQAEASGFLYVTHRVWLKGWRKVWFEGDSAELTKIINTCSVHTKLGHILTDIRHWISLLPCCSLAAVNRERNQAADKLAKSIYTSSLSCCIYSHPPRWLTEYLYPPFTV